jgi:hypothetical protein
MLRCFGVLVQRLADLVGTHIELTISLNSPSDVVST